MCVFLALGFQYIQYAMPMHRLVIVVCLALQYLFHVIS